MHHPRIAAATLFVALLGWGTLAQADSQRPTTVHIVQSVDNHLTTPQVAAGADHVVVADVVRRLDTSIDGDMPSTRFEIAVVANLWGRLPVSVEVVQRGGSDAKEHRLVLVEGDRTLVPGDRVLLAMRTTPDGQQVIPAAGNRLLEKSTPWEAQPAVVAMRDALAQR